MACWELGCQPGIPAIGVTPKSVDVTTHNGEPSEYREHSSDTGNGRATPKPVDVTTHNGGAKGSRGPRGLATVVSQPNRLKPQHIALYRSAAEKRTINNSDSMPRHQLAVWRSVIASDCQRP
jgi:hypothetical protein